MDALLRNVSSPALTDLWTVMAETFKARRKTASLSRRAS